MSSVCILVHFNASQYQAKIHIGNSLALEDGIVQEAVYEYILRNNAEAIKKQKFSLKELLLILDSTFPPTDFGTNILQTGIVESQQNVLIQIPTAVIIGTANSRNTPTEPKTRLVISALTTALLIFISFDLKTLSVGCFTCDRKLEQFRATRHFKPAFPLIILEYATHEAPLSYKSLTRFWMKLNSNLNFGYELPKQYCLSIPSYKIKPTFKGEICQIYESYFESKNCSSFKKCLAFYTDQLELKPSPSRGFHYLNKIFPAIQHQVDFKFQVLFPKTHFFSGDPAAYVTPFDATVWLYILLVIFIISIWLIFVEKERIEHVIIWQFSVLLEKEGGHQLKTRKGPQGIAMITVWIFSAIYLRHFYNSSLYSFMTSEQKPKDFPKSMDEVFERNDFDLILPYSFMRTKLSTLFREQKANRAPQLVRLYRRLMNKSYFLLDKVEVKTLQNVSDGKKAHVGFYISKDKNPITHPNPTFTWNLGEKLFTKYATMCEEDCNRNRNLALVSQKKLHRIEPQQTPFFRSFEYWTVRDSNFASLQFPKFLGSFVQSGIYALVINRYNTLQQLKLMQGLNAFRKLEMSNGSLFSYIFLAKMKLQMDNTESPTKISAFFVLLFFPAEIVSEPQQVPQQQFGSAGALPPVPSPSYGPPGHTPGKPLGLDGSSGGYGSGGGGSMIAGPGKIPSPAGGPGGARGGMAPGLSGSGGVGGSRGGGAMGAGGARTGPPGAGGGGMFGNIPQLGGRGNAGGAQGNAGGVMNNLGGQGNPGGGRGNIGGGLANAVGALGNAGAVFNNLGGGPGNPGGGLSSLGGGLANAGGAVQSVGNALNNLAGGLGNAVGALGNPGGGRGAAGNTPSNMGGGLANAVGAIGNIGAAFNNLGGGRGTAGGAQGSAGGVLNNFGGAGNPGGGRGNTGGAPNNVGGGLANAVGAQGNAGAAFNNQGGGPGNIGGPLNTLGGGLGNAVGALGNTVGALGNAGAAFNNLGGAIGNAGGGRGNPGGALGNIGSTLNNLGGAQGNAGSALGGVFGNVPGSFPGVSNELGNGMTDFAGGTGGGASATMCRNTDPNANKQLVMNYYQDIFGDKKVELLENYIAPDIINHNPMTLNGIDGLRQIFSGPFGQGPPVKIEFMRVSTDGDQVWTHVKLPVPALGMVFAAVDIFKINCQGLIQEHWDVLQGINVQSMNPRPFF
ncbi:unnamed protein product [Orchesella dallaii]|uniref:SnoaL-like domain-containing protein n=1 Tax=Orchesella dallaii TaxID=48710 RepID=A0ABP1RHP8_9HEXA